MAEKEAEVKVETEVPPETKTFTQEEYDTALRDKDGAYQGLQKVISKKDLQIGNLETNLQGYDTLKDTVSRLEVEMAYRNQSTEEEPELEGKPKTPNITEILKQSDIRRQVEKEREQFSKDLNEVMEQIVDAGFDPKHEDFAEAEFFATHGNFALAKKKVKEVVDRKKKPEDTETLDQKVEKRAQEMLRERGSFQTETVSPAGGALGIPTDMGQFREWIARMPQEEYEEKYAAEVNKMMKQNKIK